MDKTSTLNGEFRSLVSLTFNFMTYREWYHETYFFSSL
jgi:hypothetical protein